MPIYNSLVGNTILVIQNLYHDDQDMLIEEAPRNLDLKNLRESLDDTCVFITIHLDDVDEGYFGFRTVTKWFEDGSESLVRSLW